MTRGFFSVLFSFLAISAHAENLSKKFIIESNKLLAELAFVEEYEGKEIRWYPQLVSGKVFEGKVHALKFGFKDGNGLVKAFVRFHLPAKQAEQTLAYLEVTSESAFSFPAKNDVLVKMEETVARLNENPKWEAELIQKTLFESIDVVGFFAKSLKPNETPVNWAASEIFYHKSGEKVDINMRGLVKMDSWEDEKFRTISTRFVDHLEKG